MFLFIAFLTDPSIGVMGFGPGNRAILKVKFFEECSMAYQAWVLSLTYLHTADRLFQVLSRKNTLKLSGVLPTLPM